MKYGITLTKEENDALTGVLEISCGSIHCSICPFRDEETNYCGLSAIKGTINKALIKIKGDKNNVN